MTDTWEDDPYKDESVYVDGREVLDYIKSIEEDEDLDESLNWSDNDATSWDKDKNFSTDPTFIPDPNWTPSPEKSYWVQGSAGGSSESGEDVNESDGDWSWLEDTIEHPNYKGHPQGVVYLFDHDDIDEFCDIIENYNGGVLYRDNVRKGLHDGLESRRDDLESEGYDASSAILSCSFFVEKTNPGFLSLGWWDYPVRDSDIMGWLNSDRETFNKEYTLYTSVGQVRKIFEDYKNPELIKESDETDEFDWIRDVTGHIKPGVPPRTGDVLICLPGFKDNDNEEDGGGAGYVEGRIIVVGEVEWISNKGPGQEIIIWPDENESKKYWDDDWWCFDCGIYNRALTYY